MSLLRIPGVDEYAELRGQPARPYLCRRCRYRRADPRLHGPYTGRCRTCAYPNRSDDPLHDEENEQ